MSRPGRSVFGGLTAVLLAGSLWGAVSAPATTPYDVIARLTAYDKELAKAKAKKLDPDSRGLDKEDKFLARI